MQSKGQGVRGKAQGDGWLSHAPALGFLAAMSIVWTWPLVLHFSDHIPGPGGDNYNFLWNLWWMRKALSAPELEFFQSRYLFSPFGIDLIRHPHAALQSYVSATALGGLSIIASGNLYVLVSVFLNAACAYALACDLTRQRRAALLTGIAFGGSPYVATLLLGHFELLTAWVVPLFALSLRRALRNGGIAAAIGCGLCASVAAYAAYEYVVYLGVFAVTYTVASWYAAGPVFRFQRPAPEPLWRGAQALMITVATFALICLPLIAQMFRLVLSGRYVSQKYVWGSGPAGVDALAPLAGNQFHPLYGRALSAFHEYLDLDRIDAVGWLGILPLAVLLIARGTWLDTEEARRWKVVLIVFAIWALGPSLTIGGLNTGVPLPQALARFVPLVEIARLPGRAMACVYLALGVLMAQRVAGVAVAGLKSRATVSHGATVVPVAQGFSPAWVSVLIALLAFDYLHAPIQLTALDRPAVYEQLASIADTGAVIEVPFGVGDGLLTGVGTEARRVLYNATIHGHPVVGGYVDWMPPHVAQAYDAMPVVGSLLRLSNGKEAIEESEAVALLPFRYLVLDTNTATPELIDYVRRTLDMDLISTGGGKRLYAVQGVRPANIRASR